MLHPCPCCGYHTLEGLPPGSFDLCPICCWEDTEDLWGTQGSNGVDLQEAQANFMAMGICEPGWEDVARSPGAEDRRFEGWSPLATRRETEREAVRRCIQSAFEGVRRHGGMTIYDAELADDYGMESERAAAIRGLDYARWEDIEGALLQDFPVLSFFDPTSFRFHMPAYMLMTLDCAETSASIATDYTLYALDPGPTADPLYDWHMERFAGFTQPQRDAVVAFLRWCRDFAGRYLDVAYVSRALCYWTTDPGHA